MYKRWIPTLLISLSAIISSFSFAQPQTEQMEKIINTYVANKYFMGSVLVARDNDIILSKSYGSANLEWDIPNTPSTKFRLGSITKQFTAACILLLEQQGKLKTTDLIKKHIPNAPAAWDKISIFHLLTHTSGIPNLINFPEFQTLRLLPSTPEQTMQMFLNKPLEFEPGTAMSYSNSGYVALGALIEKVSGQSYEQFLQENIFNPLDMKDSGFDSNTAIIARRAAGYTPNEESLVNADYTHMSMPHACGALYSTTEDLLKWEKALWGEKILSAASVKKMIAPYKDNYALGLFVRKNNGRTVIEHSGAIQGFNTKLAYYPKTKLTFIVLSNINGDAPEKIVSELDEILQPTNIKH